MFTCIAINQGMGVSSPKIYHMQYIRHCTSKLFHSLKGIVKGIRLYLEIYYDGEVHNFMEYQNEREKINNCDLVTFITLTC